MTDPHPAVPPTYPLPASTFHALVGPTARTAAALPWATATEPLHTGEGGTCCWAQVHWQNLLDDNPELLSFYVPYSLLVFDEVSMLLAVHGATAHWRCVLLDQPGGPWLVTDTLTASLDGRPLPAELADAVTRELPQDLGWVAGPPPLTASSTTDVSIWHQPSLHASPSPSSHRSERNPMSLPPHSPDSVHRNAIPPFPLARMVSLAMAMVVAIVLSLALLPTAVAFALGAASPGITCLFVRRWARQLGQN